MTGSWSFTTARWNRWALLELFDRPDNLFVARFIGSPSMNLIEGHLQQEGGKVLFQSSGISQPIAGKPGDLAGRKVVPGFRPEHITFLPESEMSGITAEVTVVEPAATETLLHLKSGDDDVLLAEFRERLDVKPGDLVGLDVDPTRIHLAGSGRRIE